MKFTILFLLMGLVMQIDVYAQPKTAKDLKDKFTSSSSNMQQNKNKTKDKKQSLSGHMRPDNIESVAVRNAFDGIGEGDYSGAYNELNAYANSDADAAFGMGLIYYENDQIDNAIVSLRRAIQLDPDQTEALYVLGLVYAEQGDYDKAEDAFIDLIEKDPLDADAWYELGFLYYDAGFTEDAEECLAVALEIDPNYSFNSYED